MAVTKKDIAVKIADRFSLNRKEAKEIVDMVFEEMKDSLAEGEDILISDFGTFKVRVGGYRYPGNNEPREQILEVVYTQTKAMKALVNRRE